MATYRKPLYDNEGNIIIPAMTSDQTGWVKSADIDDKAVTSAKIDFSTIGNSYEIFSATSEPYISTEWSDIATKTITTHSGRVVVLSQIMVSQVNNSYTDFYCRCLIDDLASPQYQVAGNHTYNKFFSLPSLFRFSNIPAGEHTVKIQVRASQGGTAHVVGWTTIPVIILEV